MDEQGIRIHLLAENYPDTDAVEIARACAILEKHTFLNADDWFEIVADEIQPPRDGKPYEITRTPNT